MKCFYVTNARIPTEKAHGLQIVKMCEAFQRGGIEVDLIVPVRKQSRMMQGVRNVWEFYDVAPVFRIRHLWAPDFLIFEKFFSSRVMMGAYYAQCFLFAVVAFIATWKTQQQGFYYTRDLQTAAVLCLTKSLHRRKVYFEAHEFHGDQNRKGFRRRLYSRFMQWILSHIDGLVVITDCLKKLYLSSGIAAERVYVAPDGVEQKRLSTTLPRSEARRLLQMPFDKKIICYTGHLFRWKGVYTLAESGKYLPENVLIYIVGGMEADITSLRAFVAEQRIKNVHILGYRPYREIPDYLAAADVLVLPNSASTRIAREYTSPLKLFEYMGARRPIVATDLPSLREVLRQQDNAYLVPPDDPRALAAGIVQVFTDDTLAEHISNTAYADVQEYTWEQRAKHILTFLEKIT